MDKNFAVIVDKIKEIAKIISGRREYKIEGNLWILDTIVTKIARRIYFSKLKTNDKNFTADEKCIKCGTCEQICPVKNIKLENGKPAWQHNCEQCLACYHWCPAAAIQYGDKTRKKKRYHHPETKLTELK